MTRQSYSLKSADRTVVQTAEAALLITFGCLWAGFGIFAFVQISAWGREYDRKMSLIESGKVDEETLYVAHVGPSENGGWSVSLSATYPPNSIRRVYRNAANLDDCQIGMPTTAYRFGDDYLIPQFDRGGHNWGRWVFLAFGLGPPLVVAGVRRLLRKRTVVHSPGERQSSSRSPNNAQPPNSAFENVEN